MNATLPSPDTSTYVPPMQRGPLVAAAPVAEVDPRLDGTKRLIRPRQGRRIGGVCAAVAQRYDWDPTLIRVIAVLSIFLPGPQVLAYLAAWLIFPSDD